MPPFACFADLRAVCLDLPSGYPAASNAVAMREDTLTKPPKSLGRLEELVAFLAHWQGHAPPRLERTEVLVFAGNHGVTAQGVSAYPAEVTVQMVANFSAGGAAINQLARAAGASLRVIPLALETPTADFTKAPALGEAEFSAAVATGCGSQEGSSPKYDSTPAGDPYLCAFWRCRRGVDARGAARKRDVTDRALALHAAILNDPLRIAAAFGGRELAAILGATLAARRHNIPVLLDGFVCTATVAPLYKLRTDTLAHALAGHVSAEAGHRALLDELKLKPLLDLNMRLGEASGAATALLILRAALACHTGMATFAEAGLSDKPADESAEPKAAG
jgi:nicotinate-nucleotide--dimethylbenzimidazole phosphoribosyltransferase